MKKQLIGKFVLAIAIVFAVVSFALNMGPSKEVSVDADSVHNRLVELLQEVMDKEQLFYDEYWVLVDEGDTSLFLKGRDDFASAYSDLDNYMSSNVFTVEHTPVMEVYGGKYKPFMDGYMDYAFKFSKVVKEDGFTYEKMEPFFPKMQELTDQFIEVNNELVTTMNSLIKKVEL